MTKRDMSWAHKVCICIDDMTVNHILMHVSMEQCVYERHQGMRGVTVGTKVREVMPTDIQNAIAVVRKEKRFRVESAWAGG